MSERQLLPWQAAAQRKYLEHLQKDFLLVAVPGAGKTFWTMHTARELKKNLAIEHIVIVAPTTHVKGQWARTAHELGLNIESDYRNSDGAWPADADGVSMTYSQMFEQRSLHRLNVSRRPTLVIADEVHHLQDAAGWGEAAREAFDMAAYRIHLSGTPWNKDGYIPWVNYDASNTAVADFSYSYQQSLIDQVNCDVFFPKLGGRIEWEFDGQIHRHTFEDKLSERDRARRLTTSLAVPQSDFVQRAFQQADSELTRIRQMPRQDRAGGLIIAKDIAHANAIADLICNEMRQSRPPVIASDDREAGRNLREFAKGTDRWLVSVRMVSEGVDIPRLRALIYATNVTTRLFFRQAVGRVIRGPEPPAVVVLPADPLLLAYAAEIREERMEALRVTTDRIDEAESRPEQTTFQPRTGETFFDGVIHADDQVTQQEIDQASEEIRRVGAQPTIENASLLAKVLRHRNGQPPLPTVQEIPTVDSPLQSERREALRKAQNKVIQSYCFQTGADYAAVNAQLNDAVTIKRVRNATEDQLRKRYELAKRLWDR